jgi:hypothetical protein
MKWITREKIKVDRVAGPWPIRNVVYDAPYGECKRRVTMRAKVSTRMAFSETKMFSKFELPAASAEYGL